MRFLTITLVLVALQAAGCGVAEERRRVRAERAARVCETRGGFSHRASHDGLFHHHSYVICNDGSAIPD